MPQIVLPLSMPIIAAVILLCCVDRRNDWFHAMVFIRNNERVPSQIMCAFPFLQRHFLKERKIGAIKT